MTGAELYLQYLQALSQLTEEAVVAAKEQNWDRLVSGLTHRQTLMDQIDALPEESRRLTPEQALHAASLLERMAHLDAASQAVVDTAMSTTRSALQEGTQTRAGISAYRRSTGGNAQAHEARFVDKNR